MFLSLAVHSTPTHFTAAFLGKFTWVVKDLESAMKTCLGRATMSLVQYLLVTSLRSLLVLFICGCGLFIPSCEPQSH